MKCAQRAGKHFQAENVDLILQLGDILDGKSGENVKRDLLERVLPALKCTTKRKFDGSECSEYGSGVSGCYHTIHNKKYHIQVSSPVFFQLLKDEQFSEATFLNCDFLLKFCLNRV